MKERLRIGREKDKSNKENQIYKRKRRGHQKQKTTRNSTWPLIRLKQGDEIELVRLALETEEERRAKRRFDLDLTCVETRTKN